MIDKHWHKLKRRSRRWYDQSRTGWRRGRAGGNVGRERTILEAPVYSRAEAARLLGIAPATVSRWLSGYEYERSGERIRKEPVIASGREDASSHASFLELIDMLFVREFTKRGVSLQRMRKALKEAREYLGTDHFARRDFWTVNKRLFVAMDERAEAIRELLTGGQWTIAPVIKGQAEHIDFTGPNGLASRWHPLGAKVPIILDPAVQYGVPTIPGTRITTFSVADFYRAENGSMRRVREWFGALSDAEIRAAVEFENKFGVAA